MTKTITSNGHVALCRALLEARIEGGQRRVDLFELVVLGRAIGFRSAEILPIVEAATEPDHWI